VELIKKEEILLRAMGEALRVLRIEAGYRSMESFAHDICMDSALYGRYERGENIKIISLSRLLSHHKINIDEYFKKVFNIISEQQNNKQISIS
jgi:hypothetical protein